jgi:beta-glucosidase
MVGRATGGWTIEADEPGEPIEGGVFGGLSFDEKAALTSGVDLWHTAAVERVGLPALRLSDGPSGVRGPRFTGDTSVCVPCGSALAATWNRDLIHRVGRMLGDQAGAKEVHVLLAPTVNLHRHPLGGRHFEAFSEDPYLSAELAVAYIRGVQSRGVACTVKHLVANDQEHDRMEISVEVDERTLREVYLRPFEAAVREAGVWAVMAAYNRLNGVHCSEHAGLLEGILRREWGFDGLVMSDWYGSHSTAAVAAGLDLEMPGPPRYLGPFLASAIHQGDLPETVLDRAAGHLLGLANRVTGPAPDAGSAAPREDPAELARLAGREAIVLLRNDGVLPLDPARHRTIAVVGPKADRPDVQGGGSAHVHPPYYVTPLEGITQRADRDDAAITVHHESGVVQPPLAPLGRRELQVPGSGERGVVLEHFAGPDLEGAPLHTEVVADTELFWIGPPVPGVSSDAFSVRASAALTPDRSGAWALSLTSAGAARVLVDGAVVLDNLQPEPGSSFFGRGSLPVEGQVELQAGTTYRLTIELHSRISGARNDRWISGVNLHAQPPPVPDAQARAVAAAADADVALVLVGAAQADSEGGDREGIDLPVEQDELVRAVAAANPATVVVVNSGSPVAMSWVDEVGAIAQLWYPGQEAGTALAEVLFGDTDAAGRLPTTFPRQIEDSPAFPTYPGQHGRAPYSEGVFVGYRHYDANQVEPLFCFGHGLSYTRFEYGNLTLEVDGAAKEATVSVDVTNVGDRWGQEVVQLYVRDLEASVARPERELQQFAKVGLEPGATQTVRLDLPRRAFAFWDVHRHEWVVEPGEFEIAVGSSSRHIHHTARLQL